MLNTQFPCFSIIIPIYNTEKELSRCLDSILNQEYPNYEIILVDDGSRDRSGELCDQYARKNKQIKVVQRTQGALRLEMQVLMWQKATS